jgi:uncharacterized protein
MSASTATVTGLWRYPVKSLGGEPILRARLAPGPIHRIEGDREWGVFDAATGKLLSAKSVGLLLTARARWSSADGETLIDLPTTTTPLPASSPETSRALSAWLDRDVILRHAPTAATSTVDIELDDGTGDGPRGLDSFDTQPGMLYDSRSTLHVLSAATAAALDRDHGPGGGDLRRFRPNVVVDGLDAFGEDAWVDADVQLGTVVAHVRKRTERCVIISRAQPGVDADRALLRHLKATRDLRLGVYLDPRGPGEVALGDPVARVTVSG